MEDVALLASVGVGAAAGSKHSLDVGGAVSEARAGLACVGGSQRLAAAIESGLESAHVYFSSYGNVQETIALRAHKQVRGLSRINS